jgi:hypothetical protein
MSSEYGILWLFIATPRISCLVVFSLLNLIFVHSNAGESGRPLQCRSQDRQPLQLGGIESYPRFRVSSQAWSRVARFFLVQQTKNDKNNRNNNK